MVRGQKPKAIVQAHIKQWQMVALSRAGLEVQAKPAMGQKEIYQEVLAAFQRHYRALLESKVRGPALDYWLDRQDVLPRHESQLPEPESSCNQWELQEDDFMRSKRTLCGPVPGCGRGGRR